MPRRISAKKRAALINDIIHADFDLTGLREKYGLSPDHLSDWVRDEKNRHCLTGLCVLADIQTQLLLSRYRLIAAGKLYELATSQTDDSKTALDIARRSCVDLLKLDLRRASHDGGPGAASADDPGRGLRSLYDLFQSDTQANASNHVDHDTDGADADDA